MASQSKHQNHKVDNKLLKKIKKYYNVYYQEPKKVFKNKTSMKEDIEKYIQSVSKDKSFIDTFLDSVNPDYKNLIESILKYKGSFTKSMYKDIHVDPIERIKIFKDGICKNISDLLLPFNIKIVIQEL